MPFLARDSVAVAPAFAHCTNPCTRRKVTVTAQTTKQENRKMERKSEHENSKQLLIRTPRAALLLLSQPYWWEADEQSQDNLNQNSYRTTLSERYEKRQPMHGRNRNCSARARSRPEELTKYMQLLGPELARKALTRSPARSSRERRPTDDPGAMVPTLRRNQRRQPSKGGGPSLDPRVIRNRSMQNLN